MNVGTLMTRHVVTVGMDDTLEKVRDLFHSFRFHHLVVTEHGLVVGVVSDRDLLKNLSPYLDTRNERAQDVSSLRRRVHQIMTRRLVCVGEAAPVEEAARLMLEHRVTCLPVVDPQGRCRGILTQRDILRWWLTSTGAIPGHCTVPLAPGADPARRAA